MLIKVDGGVNMNELQREELQELFRAVDSVRLMNAPGSKLALMTHGIMLGMREALELKKLKVEGITGNWYYEKDKEGNPKRQKSASQLMRKEGKSKEMELVAEGNAMGVRWTLEILRLIDDISEERIEFVKEYKRHHEEMINSLFT